MKYIVFSAPDGMPRCVIFAAPALHDGIARAHAPEGWQPRSAGFIEFLGAGRVRCFGRNESLNLGPEARDTSLLEVMISATLRLGPPS